MHNSVNDHLRGRLPAQDPRLVPLGRETEMRPLRGAQGPCEAPAGPGEGETCLSGSRPTPAPDPDFEDVAVDSVSELRTNVVTKLAHLPIALQRSSKPNPGKLRELGARY